MSRLPSGIPFFDFLNSRLYVSDEERGAIRAREEANERIEAIANSHRATETELRNRIEELESLLHDIGRTIEGSKRWGVEIDTDAILADIGKANTPWDNHPVLYYRSHTS